MLLAALAVQEAGEDAAVAFGAVGGLLGLRLGSKYSLVALPADLPPLLDDLAAHNAAFFCKMGHTHDIASYEIPSGSICHRRESLLWIDWSYALGVVPTSQPCFAVQTAPGVFALPKELFAQLLISGIVTVMV